MWGLYFYASRVINHVGEVALSTWVYSIKKLFVLDKEIVILAQCQTLTDAAYSYPALGVLGHT